MKSSPSSSVSTSSSYSLSATGLIKRRETLFKKAYELATLCEIEVCVIHYGPDGELKTWPEDKQKVKDMALRYIRLDESKRRKKSVNLNGFLKKKKTTMVFKKNTNVLKYPISDHYSPDQISQLIQSLELAFSTLQARLRFVEEAQKQNKETRVDHDQGLTPPMTQNLQDQTQSLNPSQFSVLMYNHGDDTLSQIPLSAYQSMLKDNLMHQELNQNNNFQHQDYSGSGLIHKEVYNGYDQNMCLSNINSNNFQHLDIQDYSALQGSVNNYELNQSSMQMQHEMYGYDQNMYMTMSDSITNNSQLPYELCFQDPYSDMVTNTSF